MNKTDNNTIVWTTPHEDIDLEYTIVFMYSNGTHISTTTTTLTEYQLDRDIFDECQLISVSVMAKAVCGNALSNIAWWNGTVLSESVYVLRIVA